MTEIIYAIDVLTIISLVIIIPIICLICLLIYHYIDVRDYDKDYTKIMRLNEALKEYQERRWDIEDDIESTEDNYKDLKKRNNELKEKIKIYEHELITLDGLYASDNKEFKEPFRLDFSKIIK